MSLIKRFMILDDIMTVNLILNLRPLPIYFIQEIKNEVG